jgi:hypothetical protein
VQTKTLDPTFFNFIILDTNALTFGLDCYDLLKMPREGYIGQVVNNGDFSIYHPETGRRFFPSKVRHPDAYVYTCEEKKELFAFAFTATCMGLYGEKETTVTNRVVIADCVENAGIEARKLLPSGYEWKLFNHGFSALFHARIECRESPDGWQFNSVKKVYDGLYCFLDGHMCCVKGDKQTIERCKRVDTEQMIHAVIYNDDHYIYPKSY